MKLSVVASALSNDPREAARRARELGFAGVLFNARSPAMDLTALSITGRRDFARVLATEAQTLFAIRAEIGTKGFAPTADIDRLLAQLEEVLHLAADLRAGVVTIDLGPLPAPQQTISPKPAITPELAGAILLPDPTATTTTTPQKTDPPDAKHVASVDFALAALGEIADRYRVVVAFSSSLASYAAIERAILVSGCPWFGIDLDPVAMLIDRWSSDETFSRLGSHIRHLRGRDAFIGEDSRIKAMPIGQGRVDWDNLIANLRAGGYHGAVTIDPADLSNRARAASMGAEFLRLQVQD